MKELLETFHVAEVAQEELEAVLQMHFLAQPPTPVLRGDWGGPGGDRSVREAAQGAEDRARHCDGRATEGLTGVRS